LPLAALDWRPMEVALFVLTSGRFDIRKAGRNKHQEHATNGGLLISVVCPSSDARHPFHPLLYQCFCNQSYEPKELVMVDTGSRPSAFMHARAQEDPRVIYCFFPGVQDSREMSAMEEIWGSDYAPSGSPWVGRKEKPARRPETPEPWTLGLKRNIACCLAKGRVLAHFDDDDLYAPNYLRFMCSKLMKAGIQAAEGLESPVHVDAVRRGLFPIAATLAHWHMFDLSTQQFAFMDPEKDPAVEKHLVEPMQYGFGFSFVYTKTAWESEPFPDVEFSEDGIFTACLLQKGIKVELVRLVESEPNFALAAHSYHPQSTSGGAGFVRSREKIPIPKPFQTLVPVARSIVTALGIEQDEEHWQWAHRRSQAANETPHDRWEQGMLKWIKHRPTSVP